MMQIQAIELPERLWFKLPHIDQIVDIRLRDGRLIKSMYLSRSGQLQGKIITGQDGMDRSVFDFCCHDIEAVRRRDGLLGYYKLLPWKE